jgi:phosphoribosylformylglycinamidine synthase
MLTCLGTTGQHLRLPINHYEGNYTCSAETLRQLDAEGQIPLRYVTNPNGSMGSVAAVANAAGNVVGLMPHPERACDSLGGLTDGMILLNSFLDATRRRVASTSHAAPLSTPDSDLAESVHQSV